MKTFDTDDNTIFVGQNAYENDELFKRVHVKDVVSHVRGLPGAHVWFHSKDGSPPNRAQVIECAQICKEFSKCGSTRITVEYMSKRYVSKDYSKPGLIVFRKRPDSVVV